MEYEEFKKRLKEVGLSVKEFSKIAETSYNTCNTWSRNNKVPNWVKPFLNLYLESQEYKKYKESIQTLMSGLNTEK